MRDSERAVAKIMVEDCLALSIKELFDRGLIEQGSRHVGSLRYVELSTFQFDGLIQYRIGSSDPEKASLQLRFEAEGLPTENCILLAAIGMRFGGRRWYFRCPLNDIRVTKLYLPPEARRFASREAHELIHRCHAAPKRKRSCEGGGRLVVIETSKLGPC